MKTNFLFTLLMLISLNIYAQINLEHTFPNSVYCINTQTRTIYCTSSYRSDTLTIYNSDYSFYKSISITPPYGYEGYSSFFENISDKVFNLDNDIEFTRSYIDTLNNTGYLLILYNENGSELMNFENCQYGYYHQTQNDELRFKLERYPNYPNSDRVTDIYSLPGSLSSIQPQIGNNITCSVHPNPAEDFIFINYKIDVFEITDLIIYNSNGIMIESKKIGGAFDKIKLDISDYKPGVYIYRYNDMSDRFIVK